MSWTLEISGVERSLTDLGIEEDSSTLYSRNGSASVLKLVKPGPMDGALMAAYDSEVILRRDRELDGAAWSGGSIRFRGFAALPTRSGSGSGESVSYEFRDWWWKAERCVYHQAWHQVTGVGPGGVKTYTDIPVANVFLGVALDGTRWTSGEQIEDAIEWLISRTACVQLGTIEADVVIFSVEGRSISVAEVLRSMLAHSPDAQFITDYTTTPPTVHVRKNVSLAAAAITAGTDPITELSLTPKYDLQVPVVVVHFKTSETIDGNVFPHWTKQVYPPNPGGYTDLEWETQIGALIATLELEGSSTSFARASIITEAVAANSGTLADRIAWWQEFEKPLSGANIDPASITLATPYEVTDESGDTVSLSAYPYRLLDGTLAPWMDVGFKRVTINAKVSYTQYNTTANVSVPSSNRIVKKAVDREISAAIVVCDFDTAGVDYTFQTRATWVDGEPEPAGLAQAYYNSLATLRYEGQITDIHNELPDENLLAFKLTLAGTALSIEDQLIQEVAENLGTGIRTISIGLPPVLDIEGLMDLHRACRSRRVWNNPRLMVTGDPADNSLELGANSPRRDTTSGNGVLDIAATSSTGSAGLASGDQTLIKHDAVNQMTILQVIKSDGTQRTDAGSILLELARAYGLTIRLREAKVCLPDGTTMYCLGLFSAPYDLPIISGETPIGSDEETP